LVAPLLQEIDASRRRRFWAKLKRVSCQGGAHVIDDCALARCRS
jgi:hypothetical protein